MADITDSTAMLILQGAEEEDDHEKRDRLIRACDSFLESVGLLLPEHERRHACERLLDFVKIATDHDEDHDDEYY